MRCRPGESAARPRAFQNFLGRPAGACQRRRRQRATKSCHQLVVTRPDLTPELAGHIRRCFADCIEHTACWSVCGAEATVGPFALQRLAAGTAACSNLPDALLWGLACLAVPAADQPPRLTVLVATALHRLLTARLAEAGNSAGF